MSAATVTGLLCAECTLVDDPAPWCDCRADERCTGPCRWRAHAPKDCPFLTAYVPMPTPWRLVKVDDVIVTNAGKLLLVVGRTEAPWRLLVAQGVVGGPSWLATDNPDYPVPVLVPYAERAAELVLRENDRQRGHRSEIIERTDP